MSRTSRSVRLVTLPVVTVLAAVAVLTAGCSGGPTPAAGPCGRTSSAPDGVPGNVLPPVFVEPTDTAVRVDVGRFLYVVDGSDVRLSVDAPDVVEVLQPRDDGSARFTAGGRVLAPGTARITVTPPSGPERTLEVTAVCPLSGS